MKYLLLVTTFFFSTALYAEVSFHYSPSEEWNAMVQEVVDKVEAVLPADWPEIGHCQIYYVESADASYRPLFRYQNKDMDTLFEEKLLILNSNDPEIIAHEYSHFLLDDYMRKASGAWQHFFYLTRYQSTSATQTLEQAKKTLASLESTLVEFENDDKTTLNLDRLRNSIKKTKKQIVDLTNAIEIEKQYDYSLYGINSFRSMSPYYELHADTLAAIALNDWNSMSRIMEKSLNNPEVAETLVLPNIEPKEAAKIAYINARKFQDGLDPETYDYQAWEAKGDYFQFAPVRSYIKSTLENSNLESKKEFVGKFTQALISIYENSLLPNPDSPKRPLKEKNLELVAELRQN